MRYMMFIKHPEDYRNTKPPQALMDAMGEFVAEGMKNGTFLDGAGLKPLAEATRVRLSSGKITTTDGPFSEAKEVVGGYAIVELKSKEEAIALAQRFMELHRIHWPEFEGESELRPLEDQPPQ
ncbi:MAG: YciI family protein [Gemmatimonadaceae bacterium]